MATLAGVVFVLLSIPPNAEGKTDPPAGPPIGQSTGQSTGPASIGTPIPLRAIQPEAQTEGHTCGLHAVRMAYASHGLEPNSYDLRTRLGVDAPAIRWLESTTGMLPQDLFRVLDADGFAWKCVQPDAQDADQSLRTHLASGVALAVVPYSATELHWIVLRPDTDGAPVILDPAGGSQRPLDIDAFLAERALSVVLLRVRGEDEPRQSPTAAGWAQMRDVMAQMAKD